jgi:Tol biopolymer transport system component
MTRGHGARTLATLTAIGGFLLLMPACTPEPRDAAAQVPGVQNGDIRGDSSIILRRVFEGGDLGAYASEPSPDSRYLTGIDWTAGDLAVIDLLTRETRRITNKGGWDTSSEYAETSVFSPDGARIAYAWFDCKAADAGACVYEVRVSNADGSDVRTLFRPEPGRAPRPYETFYPMVFGWAGDRILAMVYLGKESDPRAELGLFSATEGSFRSLVVFGQDIAKRLLDGGQMALSADGGFAAYGIRSATGTDEDIVIVSADDGRETGRIAGPANDRVFGFAPDGGLLFASDRELTEGIWHQPLRSGRPAGDPLLLRSDLWQTYPIGMSRNALFYAVTTENEGARVASFDPETGAVISEPTPVEPPSSSGTLSPVWSPDGRHLAYERLDGRNPATIVIRSLAGDDVREIPIQQRLNNLMAWTENGTLLAIDKNESTGDYALFEMDLETGTIETLYDHPDDGTTFPLFRVSPHGPAGPRVYVARGTGDSWSLVGRDVATGREFDVLQAGDWGQFTGFGASPDGETLALLLGKGGVLTVPAAGGTIREIHSGLTYSRQGGVLWAPDNRHFFFQTYEGDPPAHTLWRADVVTGEVVRTSEPGMAFQRGGGQLHPDGRRIAFEGGEVRREVWMMTNLPGAR